MAASSLARRSSQRQARPPGARCDGTTPWSPSFIQMELMVRILPMAVAVTALLFSGVVHGLWTDRWTVSGDLAAALERLDQVPLNVGDWDGQAIPMDRNRSRDGVTVRRRFLNRKNGKMVTMPRMCGRPGPVSVHTPDVCYPASGYDGEPPVAFAFPPKSASPTAAFWTADYHKIKAAEQTNLRIFWSWNAAGQWT